MFDELWSEIAEAPGEIFDVIEYKEEWEKEEKFNVESYINGNTDYWEQLMSNYFNNYNESSTGFFYKCVWDNGKYSGDRQLNTDESFAKLLEYVQQLERRIEELESNWPIYYIHSRRTMQFQVTQIEFDFAGDNLFTENDRLDLIDETIGHIWEVDDEDDLIEEITSATGWCINSIDYRHVLK